MAGLMFANLVGCGDRRDVPRPATRMEVAGPSMAPTFVGPHAIARCDRCLSVVRIPRRLMPTEPTFPCPFCGTMISDVGRADHPADVVTIHSIQALGRPARRGEVVAVRQDNFPRLKRLIGLPGDVIDVAEDRLTVNGRRTCDVMPTATIPVDPNTARPESWWTPVSRPGADRQAGQAASAWRIDDNTFTHLTDAPPQWLVYRHKNVYHRRRADAVRDDYPGNVNLTRRLNIVDRLILTMNAGRTDDATPPGDSKDAKDSTIEVLFWTPEGVRVQHRPMPDELSAVRFSTRDAILDTPPDDRGDRETRGMVGPEHPIAIRCPPGSILSGFYLERPVDHRLNKTHDAEVYPVRLSEDQVFVLGDNVPVSIDSRDWGPIDRADLIGVVLDE